MKVTDRQIIEAANSLFTMAEGARKVGLHLSAFVARTKKLGVHNPNQARRGRSRPASEQRNRRIPLDEILSGKHPQYKTSALKRRLIKEYILPDECKLCGNKDSDHSRILDHINGVNNDHRLENLRLVCPNCNAALPTHAGRNKRKAGSIVGEELFIERILKGMSNREILTDMNMTPNGANYRRIDRLRKIIETVLHMIQRDETVSGS